MSYEFFLLLFYSSAGMRKDTPTLFNVTSFVASLFIISKLFQIFLKGILTVISAICLSRDL